MQECSGAVSEHRFIGNLIGESRKKDDRLDARALERLARIDPQLLPQGPI
jgi:hypothetical protein